jgi:GT2 family glycosyltransferase/glycosyltransferase involved in cell wall biosynthesis
MKNPTDQNHSSEIGSVTFYTNYGQDPCAHLRLRGPLRHLGIEIIDGISAGDVHPERVAMSKLTVIQRDFPRDIRIYEQIINIARKESKPVVFDIDDLLLMMPVEHPERQSQHYIESLLPMLQALFEADLITTTTPFLLNWLCDYNENVSLLPNYFDDTLWQMREPRIRENQQRPLTIGYMGSETHIPDIEFVAPVLSRLINEFPNELVFNFWGAKPPAEIINFPQVKWIPAITYNYDGFAKYFQTQSADIFIAPLVDNQFNRAKSPLKFFEYSALGVPGVYSKLETFEQAITHDHDGFLAYSPDEWYEQLVLLINNPDLRLRTAQNAQATIKENWLLSNHAEQWREAYGQVYQRVQKEPFTEKSAGGLTIIRSLNHQYYELFTTTKQDLQQKNQTILEKNQTILEQLAELTQIKNSMAWKMVVKLRQIRDRLIPPDTMREKYMNTLLLWLRGQRARRIIKQRKEHLEPLLNINTWSNDCQQVPEHDNEIDIIICVHNAFDDVKKCLNSITGNTREPYNLVIVDDGSDYETKTFLEAFAEATQHCQIIRHDTALGYTMAANAGIRASKAPFFVLLNSDTIVTKDWIDRLYRAVTKDERIGLAGPLSNTASWQSIPKLSDNGDWAVNELPNGVTVDKMAQLVSHYSACIHPKVPLLNGFCMMVRRALVDEIGLFDEANFGQGYGEEDDFNIRASQAGWKSVIADDVFIYHAQSKSYSTQKRYALTSVSGEKLLQKHGAHNIAEKVGFMNPNRVMEGIRARSTIMLKREEYLSLGRQRFEGKRLLFVLPVLDAGGGANVILDEAKHMAAMGVKVSIFNLAENKTGFLRNYAHIDIPCVFGKPQDLPKLAPEFDAVVASAHFSVPWLVPLQNDAHKPILGYYVQDFEPWMYINDSEVYQQALATYTLIESIKRFTKTQWTRNTVFDHTGADCKIVGISVNIDLFRPRDMIPMGLRPITIVAMVRPGSYYRSPEMTMRILREISAQYKEDVDIWLFGSDDIREVVDQELLDFRWRQLGKLTQVQVASMMSKADIFTDFSSHQAMGLSALEAMAAGCSVIVPKNGGAIEFVDHRVNGIVADTAIFQASLNALKELIEGDQLRKRIQIRGTHDVVQYFPEKVSYNILNTLFS